MPTTLLMLVSLLVAALAFGFYMDWFGLWVNKAEMRGEMERVKARLPEASANPKEPTPTQDLDSGI